MMHMIEFIAVLLKAGWGNDDRRHDRLEVWDISCRRSGSLSP
jgi:hypothetical protein